MNTAFKPEVFAMIYLKSQAKYAMLNSTVILLFVGMNTYHLRFTAGPNGSILYGLEP